MPSIARNATDVAFRVGLLIKGLDALFEVFGGVLLAQPSKVARYVSALTQHDVFRHHQVLAGNLDHLSQTIATHASLGEAAYLLVHGLAKVILIVAALRNKKWGFQGLILVLSIFMAIEFVRSITAREIFTGAFGLFDLVVVALVAKEYRFRYGPQVARQ
jgi:uncharacterized membrane protein